MSNEVLEVPFTYAANSLYLSNGLTTPLPPLFNTWV